ncbi:hypothetical protein [Sporosarcina beigongshangi]|uniref:hypothetical protein n=1 Tax=Sporosarcina beigongshangi TaxID=2782538 RepID=UPI00193A214C|nr:hypothetical protein [Sporosarcina beigongshangi]
MKVESVGTKAIHISTITSNQNKVSFDTVLSATAEQRANIKSADHYDVRTMSVDEMLEIETKAAAAFKHGDLISHRQYTDTLNDWKKTIQEGIQQIAAVEEGQPAKEQESSRQGLFPEDAPQSLKDYEGTLSLRGKMSLMIAVSVQKLIANAYRNSSGGWQIHRQGDPGYVDIFKQPGFSYTKLAEDMLAYMQFERTYLRPDEFKEKEDLLNGFKTAVKGY